MHALRGRAVVSRGLAHDQAIAKMVLHMAGRAHGTTGVHHTANDLVGRDGFRQAALWVHAGQGSVGPGPPKALQKPPGHAVHGGQHLGGGRHHRRNLWHDLFQGWGFHRQHNQVLRAQVRGLVRGDDLHRVIALRIAHAQAMFMQGLQGLAPRQHAQLHAWQACQQHAHPAPNGARAHHTDLHDDSLTDGKKCPVGRLGAPGPRTHRDRPHGSG